MALTAEALEYLFPDIEFGVDVVLRDMGAGAYIAEWNRAEPEPTQAELDTAQSAVDAAKVANAYKLNRRAEYPSTEDQLDAIWTLLDTPDDADALIIKNEILAIRAKYPKP